jgi:hypothetical protein
MRPKPHSSRASTGRLHRSLSDYFDEEDRRERHEDEDPEEAQDALNFLALMDVGGCLNRMISERNVNPKESSIQEMNASHHYDRSVAASLGPMAGTRDRPVATERVRKSMGKRKSCSRRQWCVVSNDGAKVVLACGDHSIELMRHADSAYVIRFEQLQPDTFAGDRFLSPLLGDILLPG